MNNLAIDARHVARRFGRRWALVDVSFQLPRGAVMMLSGQNGSGKTTLLRVLATLLRPNSGDASVTGLDVVRDREKVRRRIALLSHQSYLYESLTARENLDLVSGFCVGSGFSRTRPAEAGRYTAAEVLERVGLSERAGDAVATFSAGMRKRLSFARVLLQQRDIVFLDEPYGHLDPQGFSLVDEVIIELKGRGATLIVATHQVEHVAPHADQRLTLQAGRVAA